MSKTYFFKLTKGISAWKYLFSIFFLLVLSQSATAQVDVVASAGTPTSSYTTLGAAFAAINAGTASGSYWSKYHRRY